MEKSFVADLLLLNSSLNRMRYKTNVRKTCVIGIQTWEIP